MTAPAIESVALTPAQLLYRDEKARKGDRVQPAILEAKEELQRQDDARREAKKGGRPRGPTLDLRARRSVHLGFDDLAPGRPDRHPLDRTPPPRPTPPEPESPMRAAATFAPKTCQHCSKEFTPLGAKSRMCYRPECLKDRGAPGPKKTSAKEKKPRAIRTGFRAETPARSAPPRGTSTDLSAWLEEIEQEIAAQQLLAASIRRRLGLEVAE